MKWYQSLLSIFKSSTGKPDLSRIIALKTSTVVCSGFLYSTFHNHVAITSWTDVGAGFSAMMLGIGGLIAAKEVGVAKANVMNGAANNGAV